MADLPPYELNPTLSLTADPACQTSSVDPVPDPGARIHLRQPARLRDSMNHGQRQRLFVSYCESDIEDCGILVLDANDPNVELEEITGSTTPKGAFTPKLALLGIAVDEELGYLFVQDFATNPGVIYQFGEDYKYLSSLSDSRFKSNVSLQISISNGETLSSEPCNFPPEVPLGDACNRHFLFVPTLPSSGQLGNRALAYEPPGELPPEIERGIGHRHR